MEGNTCCHGYLIGRLDKVEGERITAAVESVHNYSYKARQVEDEAQTWEIHPDSPVNDLYRRKYYSLTRHS